MKNIMYCLFLFASLLGCEKKEEVKIEKVTPPNLSSRENLRQNAHAAASAASVKAVDKKVVDLKAFTIVEKTTKRGVIKAPRMASSFYASNLGLPVVKGGVPFPSSVEVSFDANMASFWQKKVLRDDVSDSTLRKAPEILRRYVENKRGFTNLAGFASHTDFVIQVAKKSIDWVALCKHYRLDAKQCKLVQDIITLLRGKDFIAYGMTELLPSAEGRYNVQYLDMILQNAGVSYLMHFPAMFDDFLSLGFYQFTSFSVRKDDEVTEGTSTVNGFVKDSAMKIPDSVAYLVGDDHHRAALYFAVHNLSRLVKKLDEKSLKSFAVKHQDFQDEMVMFVAAAHHSPVKALDSTSRWIKEGMKVSLERAYPPAIKLYAIKTHANLLALYERLTEKPSLKKG